MSARRWIVMILITLLAELAVGVVAGRADTGALYGGYRYSGRPTCAAQATVTLNAAHVAVGDGKNSHAAVWSGAFAAGSQAWVQAGVTQDGTGAAWAYLEWSTRHGQYRLIRLGNVSTLTVLLTQHGNAWTIETAGRTATVNLGAQTRCFVGAESEDWGSRNIVRGHVAIEGGASYGVQL